MSARRIGPAPHRPAAVPFDPKIEALRNEHGDKGP